jgi:hypothetical protein
MRKIKKLNINSLIKEFELLDEKQSAGTLGGSYYYDINTGAHLGITESGNYVRFINSNEWSNVAALDSPDAGYLFTDSSVNIFAKFNLLKSLLPQSAANVYIQTGHPNGSVAGFVNGSFFFDPNSAYFNDYNNLHSMMAHESYHWEYGHVLGSPNYSGYSNVSEIDTIMYQIQAEDYNETTNDFKICTAEYLHSLWPNKDQFGYTLDDAYRIAKVDGYYGY